MWHLHPSSRLATTDIGRKLWSCAPFLGREAGFPSNTKSPGPKPTSVPSGILIQPAVWPQWTRAENWDYAPFGGAGLGCPSKVLWPGLRPTCMPSFTLIGPTVWPQYANVTNRTAQDRQTGQDRQQSESKPFYKRSPKMTLKC